MSYDYIYISYQASHDLFWPQGLTAGLGSTGHHTRCRHESAQVGNACLYAVVGETGLQR